VNLQSRWQSLRNLFTARGGGSSSGEESDLRRRIRTLEQRIVSLPTDDPGAGGLLTNLGNRWREIHLATGDSAAIDTAIDFQRRAVELLAGTASEYEAAGNLAVCLLDRYVATGGIADLDLAVSTSRCAVAASPAGLAGQARSLANLANALYERYLRTFEAADIEAAIAAAERALAIAPGTAQAGAARANLAVALLARGRADDHRRAEEALDLAAAELPEGSPMQARARFAALIARVHGTQGAGLGAGTDGAAAIDKLGELATRAPRGSVMRAAALHALGKARWMQYGAAKDPELLDAAIAKLQAAANEAPADAGELPLYLNDLGIALSELSLVSDSAQGLAQALATWIRALNILDQRFGAIAVGYKLGQETASVGLGIAERAVAAYLILADLAVTGREQMLRNAMVVAEGTKTRLITDLIGRGNLPAPAGVPADLAAREHALLGALRAIDTAAVATHGSVRDSFVDMGARRSAMACELEALWKSLSSSGDAGRAFVEHRRRGSISWDTLAELSAMLGPRTAIASVFATNSRTVLFVLRDGDSGPTVSEIAIDRDGWLDLAHRFEGEVRAGSGSGSETWDAPMQALLRSAAHVAGAERVVVAPTSWKAQLPWTTIARRAGWRAPEGTAMPIVTVESLGLLHSLLSRTRTAGVGAIVVGDPTGDLSHARDEAVKVAEMLGVMPLLGKAATKAAVTSALRSAAIVHIAGHATFQPSVPLDSGIVLADGVLTAREIMTESIRLDLLVLSACETGVADSLAGNEFAGLSQAFHVAGVRSLVASLWKVSDPTTGIVMSRFYRNWRGGADLSRALREAMMPPDAEPAAGVQTDTANQAIRRIGGRTRGTMASTYYWESFVLSGDWSVPWPASRPAASHKAVVLGSKAGA
jgi:tetratricopeptide (TPR) repeat protein